MGKLFKILRRTIFSLNNSRSLNFAAKLDKLRNYANKLVNPCKKILSLFSANGHY